MITNLNLLFETSHQFQLAKGLTFWLTQNGCAKVCPTLDPCFQDQQELFPAGRELSDLFI